MHVSPLLAPVVVLVAWTLVMFIWMAVKRRPFVKDGGIPPGTRGADLEAKYPGSAHWPAHNYQHLMEQPTIFYAIVFALVLMGFDSSGQRVPRMGLRRPAHRPQHRSVNGERRPGALPAVSASDDLPRLPHAPRGDLPHPSRVKQAASSTWVDQRNWPTGRTQSSR